MDAYGFVLLASTGGVGIALAVVFALGLSSRRRRLDGAQSGSQDPETAAALRGIQADIDKAHGGY
jgi:uncharacterized protein (TIGR03382 family)